MSHKKDGFTLPGESGYESLTLRLAEQWGADMIRDSDGTTLSDEITNAGYGIYSTLCLIREHNAWAAKHPHTIQQTFLTTTPVIAVPNDAPTDEPSCPTHTPAADKRGQGDESPCGWFGGQHPPRSCLCSTDTLEIDLLAEYFKEQFAINASEESLLYWQVIDRTTNTEVPREDWSYRPDTKSVIIRHVILWHSYAVSFMAYRIWEEISMYNHTTNHWDKEHLTQIDPIHPEAQAYLLDYMEKWCFAHPATKVVRFTSLFYNFAWIWGRDARNRYLFTDWASYDFTVSPMALALFEEAYGYRLRAEDFINQGKRHATHAVAPPSKLDWMAFINDFVISFGKQLIDLVHRHGKWAYVFYDDSWVGIEPYNGRFGEFGFDGIIKCVFSGFEARLCAGVPAPTHELRLHPYLFPVGLGGLPTFQDGGNPARDALLYWVCVRRALLRQSVERIGLGGYLHLVQDYPDFCERIEAIANEFRLIRDLHQEGKPYCLRPKIAILHAWGKLRTWTLSGHLHETDTHDLIHILEALSGLPFEVEFLSFEDIERGIPADIRVIINAGTRHSAWSGGVKWHSKTVVTQLTRWVHNGGALIGVNEPSAIEGYATAFRMAHVLGVDMDTAAVSCHGKWRFRTEPDGLPWLRGIHIAPKENIRLLNGHTRVLAAQGDRPVLTAHAFGRGMGVYLSSFVADPAYRPAHTRLLLALLLYAAGEPLSQHYLTDNPHTECAFFSQSQKLVVVNNTDTPQSCRIPTAHGEVALSLSPFETRVVE